MINLINDMILTPVWWGRNILIVIWYVLLNLGVHISFKTASTFLRINFLILKVYESWLLYVIDHTHNRLLCIENKRQKIFIYIQIWLVDLMQANVIRWVNVYSFSTMLRTNKIHESWISVDFCSEARVCGANIMLQYHIYRQKLYFFF